MKSPLPPAQNGPPENSFDTEGTGLPGFMSWRAVYWFVAATFVLWVVLLELLDGLFS